VVRDEQRRPVGRIRDTVKLQPEAADDLKKKTVQYETGFEMPPGKYRVKIVVRENQDGAFGSYETDIVVPDLKRDALKVSSVVLGTQLQQGARKNDRNPLARRTRAGAERRARCVTGPAPLLLLRGVRSAQPVKVMTSIAFFQWEGAGVRNAGRGDHRAHRIRQEDRGLSVRRPASALKPGLYTCQINVVDDAAGSFTFPQLAASGADWLLLLLRGEGLRLSAFRRARERDLVVLTVPVQLKTISPPRPCCLVLNFRSEPDTVPSSILMGPPRPPPTVPVSLPLSALRVIVSV
jgi:hypothetical protein